MRFSVIVPVYNVADYLPQCMESLLEQECSDYEILLVDDGSTDGSEILCDGYAAAFPDRVQVLHQKNGGLGAARNTGLERARGEYLLFIDSDDWLRKDALQILDEKIRATDAKMVVFGFYYVWEDRTQPGEELSLADRAPVTLERHPELLLQTPSACLRVWHRSLFEDPEIRFPGRVWFEDLRTTPKALTCCPSVAVISDRLYYYRQRPGSILHNPNLRRNLEIIEAMEDLYGYFERRGLLERYGAWLECLAAENMILAAQRVLMQDPHSDILPEFIRYLERRFPGYETGEKVALLGRKKKLVLKLLRRRQYVLLRGIFRFRSRLRGKN